MKDLERSADSESKNSNSAQTVGPTDHGRDQGADPRTPRYQEWEESPGIEVIAVSTLEAVPPPPPQLPLVPPSATTWEEKSVVFSYGASPQTPYSAAAPASSLHSGYEHAPLAAYPPTPETRIAGLKRQTFFIILAIGVFIAVVGIAVGVGVGIALGKNNNSQERYAPGTVELERRERPSSLAAWQLVRSCVGSSQQQQPLPTDHEKFQRKY